ncbi:peptide-methionine (S)-S-oxide reductase [Sporosarcina sp. GW1-11]|uniref:peptide-methionine (S)-S-oxide reductase n=1 Tax=Sporosarcina sp. GW1-11 TaxID=2899126 RepID=UPI00294CB8E2|nr:peptide-methionine (S)-S-oxide reductase [Sporosarcina sp. GW1-11]MDV6378317.1 peptide-methionine (S)-S-oxide reductase [Sporosarcina sp. GW1-11]
MNRILRIITDIENGLTYNKKLETATFGMGCFWGPEARFGSLPGVIRTRVGYAGGTTEAPTYKTIGYHTETVEIDFDPDIIRFEEILFHFWRNHYPNRDQYKGRQYLSSLRYRDEKQKSMMEQVKAKMEVELGELIETEITRLDHFTLAEERHQKYYLKRYPGVLEQLKDFYPLEELLLNSTFATRLNGFVKGFGTREQIVADIKSWNIPEITRQQVIEKFSNIKW